ncbi:restriction endonuclease subunit S, partial [Micromonospora sp. LOL_021]|uniref:restriction endonuclease subunit S n=1 Tax=Micromonospora sp. LOL_021 TaxID=3345417 RepID=UPI003A855979
ALSTSGVLPVQPSSVDRGSGWELAPLSELVAINQRRFDAEPDDDEHISFVPMASVEAESGRLDASQTAPYGKLKQRSLTRFQEGDVLFAKVTPCMENGKIAVARGLASGRGMGSTELFSLRPHGAIDPDYLAYFLLQESVRRDAARAMTGAVGLRRVPRGYLEDLAIPVPPFAEQRRIVSALETYLASLDAATAGVKKAAARLSGWRNVLANYAIGGGSKTRSAALDGSWSSTSIGEIADVGTGATPLRSRRDYYENGTVPWVTSSAVNRPYVDSSDEFITQKALSETSVKLWSPGTLLVAMYGEGKTRGRCSELRISATTNQACAAIAIRPEYEWRRPWVKLVLRARYDENRKLAAGGVQPNLNLGMIRAMQIPLPPRDQQDRFLQEFERQDSVGAALEQKLRVVAARARVLRTALLAEAFAGWLVEQDPADEPASELLARIRAQRVVVPKQRGRRTAKELAAPATRAIGTDFQQGELPL